MSKLTPKELIENACQKHEGLLRDGSFSRPLSERCMAIVLNELLVRRQEDDIEEAAVMRQEAVRIATLQRRLGNDAYIIDDAQVSDVKAVLQDETVTDICWIGHGNFSSAPLHPKKIEPKNDAHFTWSMVSMYASHIKTGNFYHRACAGRAQVFPALGTFAVANHAHLLLPRSPYISPAIPQADPQSELISAAKILRQRTMNYPAIRTLAQVYAYLDKRHASTSEESKQQLEHKIQLILGKFSQENV